MRSTGFRVLLILALAAAFIVVIDLPGPPGSLGSRWSGGVAVVLALAASGLFAYVRNERSNPSNRSTERAIERLNSMLAFGLAFAVAAFSVIIALAVPITALIIMGAAAIWVLAWWPRRLRRLSTTTGVVIKRDPDVVFGFLSDFRTQVKYSPGVTSVEKVTDGPIGVGTQFRTRARVRNAVYEGVEQMSDYEPNTRYASSLVSSTHPNAGIATFEPIPGGTRVTFRFESELSHASALVGAGLTRWFLRRRLIERRGVMWARAKQILESETQPTT